MILYIKFRKLSAATMKSMINAFITMDTWSFALLVIILFLVIFLIFFHMRPITSSIAHSTVESFAAMRKHVPRQKRNRAKHHYAATLRPAVHRNIPSKR